MKKKLLGLALAATMLLGTSVTAFAADAPTSTSNNDVTGNATANGTAITYQTDVKTPVLKVNVTVADGTNKVIVNPYKLSVYDNVSGQTLVVPDIVFKNVGDVAVSVEIKGQVSHNNNVSLSALAAAPATSTTKQVYVAASFTDVSGNAMLTAKDAGNSKVKDLVYTKAGASLTGTSIPVLARKYQSGGSGTEAALPADGNSSHASQNLKISFGNSWSCASTTSAWSDADKFDVITTYNLKFVLDSEKVSYFDKKTADAG